MSPATDPARSRRRRGVLLAAVALTAAGCGRDATTHQAVQAELAGHGGGGEAGRAG